MTVHAGKSLPVASQFANGIYEPNLIKIRKGMNKWYHARLKPKMS